MLGRECSAGQNVQTSSTTRGKGAFHTVLLTSKISQTLGGKGLLWVMPTLHQGNPGLLNRSWERKLNCIKGEPKKRPMEHDAD